MTTEHPARAALRDIADFGPEQFAGRSFLAAWSRGCAAIPALETLLAERDALRAALEGVDHDYNAIIDPYECCRAMHARFLGVRAALAKGDS